jgi:hypothetical protein
MRTGRDTDDRAQRRTLGPLVGRAVHRREDLALEQLNSVAVGMV